MARKSWAGLSDRKVAKRLGRVLGVRFDGDPLDCLGGGAGALGTVGDDAWVVLHVERNHAHSAENVLQYWPWLERNRRRLVVVHVIAPRAKRRAGPQAELATWLGSMMERVVPGRFAYCRVELGTDAQTRQLEAAASAVDALRSPLEGKGLLPGH